MKIAFLTVMPSPYVQDVFAALNADSRCDLSVFYLEQEADNTHWGEQALPEYAEVLPGSWFRFGGGRIHYNSSAIRKLREADADVYVVVGYPGLTNQSVMYWLTLTRRPWVFWGEMPGMRSLGIVASSLRRMAQFALRNAKAIAAVGSRAVEAYQQLLQTRGALIPVFNVPYHCSTEAFTKARESHVRSETNVVRFLYCGQLIERKGVDLLVAAFLSLRAKYNNIQLKLVGSGPLEAQLRTSIPDQLQDSVIFHGFMAVSELPQIFADADVFVLPSRHDGWGVVVNQAVASRLPVIATSAVGAAHDLISHGESGYIVDPDSVESLGHAMEQFIQHPDQLCSFGERSFEFTSRISLQRAVSDWLDVCTAALRRKRQHARSHEGAYSL